MIPQEHRVIAALSHLGPLVVPDTSSERLRLLFRDSAQLPVDAIQDALVAAGLPMLEYPGRKVFTMFSSIGETCQVASDATSYWGRIWCRALGLPHRSAWDQDIIVDPVTDQRSTMTAHERIQLLREEQALAAGRRSVEPDPTEIRTTPSNKFTNSLASDLPGPISLAPREATPIDASALVPSQSSKKLSHPQHLDPRGTDIPCETGLKR